MINSDQKHSLYLKAVTRLLYITVAYWYYWAYKIAVKNGRVTYITTGYRNTSIMHY